MLGAGAHRIERRLHRLGKAERRGAARLAKYACARALERHDVGAQLLQCRHTIGGGSAVARGMQRRSQRVDEQRAHAAGIAEANLGFGRMHIDVDLSRRQRDEQGQQRMPAARNEIAVSGAHGAEQELVLHRAPVDEQKLLRGVRPVQSRQSGKARDDTPSRSPDTGTASTMNSRPMMRPRRCNRPSAPAASRGKRSPLRSPVVSVKPYFGCAMARRLTTSETAWFSARSDLRNLRRAGTLRKARVPRRWCRDCRRPASRRPWRRGRR